MHELSLASSVLEIALRHAAGRRVSRVELDVGALRNVNPEALAFGFEMVAQSTLADGAVIEIKTVAATGKCRSCAAFSEQAAFPLHCGACGGFDIEIVTGEEMTVTSLVLEDIEDGDIGGEKCDSVGDGGHSGCQ